MHQAGGKGNCSEHHAVRVRHAVSNSSSMTTLHRHSSQSWLAGVRAFSIGVVAGALLAIHTKRREGGSRRERLGGDATAQLLAATEEMEGVFQNILVGFLAEPDQHSEQAFKLSEAQKAWVAYRDAHIAAIYPEGGEHGPVSELTKASIRADLTRQRTRQLREWWE